MAINLKQKKGQTPIQENYNKSLTKYPTSGSGEGYTTIGNNYNSAFGGQFQMGGGLPGATGFMYARHGAPDNGKYAKKTKASAQSGASMKYFQNGLDYLPKGMKKGGVIEDDRGQWQHPGQITKINSNNITMQGVPYPVLGVSDTGHTQLMHPENNYQFHGNSVTEYPIMETGGSIQDKGQLQKLDDLINFTNYNNMKKAQIGARMQTPPTQFKMQQYHPIDMSAFMEQPKQQVPQQVASSKSGGFDPSSITKAVADSGGGDLSSGAASGLSSLASALAKNGGNFSTKTGKFNLNKLNKVLAKNGYEIKKFDGGGNVDDSAVGSIAHTDIIKSPNISGLPKYQLNQPKQFTSANDDPQASAWGNSNNTQTDAGVQITDPNIQTYAPGSQTDPNANIQQTTNKPNQFSVSSTPDPLSLKDKVKQLSGKITSGLNMADSWSQKNLGMGLGQDVQTVTNIANDIHQIGQDKKNAKKEHGVDRAIIAADNSRPQLQNAQYVRPENSAFQPGQLNTPKGAGTNYLAANGIRVPEIQNTFAPNNIYTDTGYEPLHDSDNIKKFEYGGGEQLGSDIGKTAGTIAGNILLPGIGGAVLGGIGSLFGRKAAKWLGADKLSDQHEKDQADLNAANFSNQIGGLQGQNAAFMENGGWMNPEYNPQLITKFDGQSVKTTHQHQMRSGGHLSQDYVEPNQSSYMEQGGDLQTHWGGKATPISYNPFLPEGGETVMFQGQSHKDGGIGVTYGSNPVEVQGGEPATKLNDGSGSNLVVFGGMKISPQAAREIGDERAEGKKYQIYAKEISKNENKSSNALEKGINLINSNTASDKFTQVGFSTGKAILDGAKMQLKKLAEQKQNLGIVQNAILDTADEHGLVADKLAENKIVPMTNKELKAKWGKAIAKAQNGNSTPLMKYDENGNLLTSTDGGKNYVPASSSGNPLMSSAPQSFQGNPSPIESNVPNVQPIITQSSTKILNSANADASFKHQHQNGNFYGNIKTQQFEQLQKNNPWYDWSKFNPNDPESIKDFQQKFNDTAKKIGSKAHIAVDGKLGTQTASANVGYIEPEQAEQIQQIQQTAPTFAGKQPEATQAQTPGTKLKGPGLEKYLPILNPLLRHKYSANLDPTQLMGEYYALSHNQLDPVKAQQYNPQLQSPYDISYQDQLNANQSTFNAGMKLNSNNPAFQASLLADKYAANEKVLGEQFRQNQGEKEKVYGENRNTLNDAQLKNLGILDQQYTREEQAKSNTKAQAINALTSIGDKIAQSRRDANEMNMYSALNPNFYVDSNGVFHNQGFASLNMQGNGQQSGIQGLAADKEKTKLDNEDIKRLMKSLPQYSSVDQRYETDAQATGKAKFGKKIPSRNSNIVKAIKNTKLYK